MIVKAKFYVGSVEWFQDFAIVKMRPVTATTEENKTWSKYTPSGDFTMQINVIETAKLYQPGDEVLIDMTLPDHQD